MRKFALCCLLATGCTQYVYAQDATATDAPHTKRYDHSVGVQLNGLIRQVINFNNNTNNTPVNPYLFNYSINSIKSGWGLRAGVGYQYGSSSIKDGITETDTRINELQARLGVERRFNLSGRWSAGVGGDFLMNNSNNYSKSVLRSTDTITTIINSKLPAYGGGIMGWLRFNVSPHVQIGTETSFYYITGTEDRTVETTKKQQLNTPPFTFTTVTTTVNSKPVLTDGSFKMPVVFYLIVKM